MPTTLTNSLAPSTLFDQARTQANEAAQRALAEIGGRDQYPCGFAWVVIRPARGPFVEWLKRQGKGHKHHAGGWCLWYSELHDLGGMQCVSIHEPAARAFAKVLTENGLSAYADSRFD